VSGNIQPVLAVFLVLFQH